MELNRFFPDKVCINLDRRPERWERVSARFQRHSIHGVERFSAVDGRDVPNPPGWRGPPGAHACAQSHLAVVRRSRSAGIPRLLIFEDDVEFDDRFNERFEDLIGGLPEKWDMLFFGSLLSQEPEMVAPGIGRVRKAHSTFAYALNHTVFDAFIEINTGAVQPVDNNNTLLQERFRCYSFFPFLAWVESGFSDVEGAVVDHWQIRESLVLKSAEMGRILAKTSVIVTPRQGSEPGLKSVHLKGLVESMLSTDSRISVVILQPANMDDSALDAWQENQRVVIHKQGTESLEKSTLLAAQAQKAAGREFFYFADSDIHLRRQDLKACFQMTCRNGIVRPFSKVVALTEDATRRLLDGKLRWFDGMNGARNLGCEAAPGVWMIGAGVLDELRDWPPQADLLRRFPPYGASASAARLFTPTEKK